MEISSLMEWCKLIEIHQIDFPEDSSSFFNNLYSHVDNSAVFEGDERTMSSKKYIGRIGQNTFEFAIKKKNTPTFHSARIKGERVKDSRNDKVKLVIIGIGQHFVRSFLLMFLMFGTIVLWPDFSVGDIIFLIIGFSVFSFLLIRMGRDHIKYLKKQLVEDFRIQF